MPRRLERIKSQDFQGFGCSECDWKFKPTGALTAASLDDMKKEYQTHRDKEFAAHICANRKSPANQKTK